MRGLSGQLLTAVRCRQCDFRFRNDGNVRVNGVTLPAGDAPTANAAARRALELALEAHLRTTTDRGDLMALLARLRPHVDAAALAPRHRDALAGIPAAPAS